MRATIESIQVGQVISEGDPDSKDVVERHWTTGFYKQVVSGRVTLTTLGLLGDSVADRKRHNGPDKAVLCYAASHYQRWAADHPSLPMSAGALAENLTIHGADETSVCVGDHYRIGRCQVQVSQPRKPCWKIARRWGVKTLTKEVTQTGRTGWFFRVITEGELEAGQALELIDRPHPSWPISRINDVMFGRAAILD